MGQDNIINTTDHGIDNNNIYNNTVSGSNNNTTTSRDLNNPLFAYENGLTADEYHAQRVAAGKASKEAQKRRKSFQEQARALLERTASRESVSNVLGDSATEFFPEGQASAGELLLARMMLEGWNGNTRAAEFTRDTAGYKPTQEISVEGMDDAARSLLDNVAKRLEKESKQG